MWSIDNILLPKKCIAAAPALPPSLRGSSWGLWDEDSLGTASTRCLCQCHRRLQEERARPQLSPAKYNSDWGAPTPRLALVLLPCIPSQSTARFLKPSSLPLEMPQLSLRRWFPSLQVVSLPHGPAFPFSPLLICHLPLGICSFSQCSLGSMAGDRDER